MVSGCVGFLREFARTFGPCPVETVSFVRKVSSFFQVVVASDYAASRRLERMRDSRGNGHRKVLPRPISRRQGSQFI